MPYHLGCTAWSQAEWSGILFRKTTKQGDYLREYASVFNTVEGNTTFYRVPDEALIKNWGSSVPDNFRFCFKFPKQITHIRNLTGTDRQAIDFVNVFEPIANKLGPFMIQLPPHFSGTDLSRLEKLLDILPRNYAYGVEVRHRDFFDHGRHEHNLESLLKSYNINRIIFDTRKLHSLKGQDLMIKEAQHKKPKVPVRFEATDDRPVIRYVGSNDRLNNEPYMKEWAIIIADWIKEGKHPYVFIHAPDKRKEPDLCAFFHETLSEFIELPTLPAFPAISDDEQLGLF